MISLEEATNILLANLPALEVESVPFHSALGRILAEDIRAMSDVPPFHRAAVDGFAVLAGDVAHAPVKLTIVGESRAGGGMPPGMRSGEAVAIMTGAPVPPGADTVQMIEQCRTFLSEGKVEILTPIRAQDNIAPQGGEAKAGDCILKSGHMVGPAEIAVLAACGYSGIKVCKRPNVAILATGDELVEFDQIPRPDQIRNSNAYCLAAQLRLLGIEADYLGIARDDKEELRRKILEGLSRDVLIITGGVSMGEYDFVRNVFLDLGIDVLFSKVAIRPGKPTVFARKGNKLIFGLPGNPLSALVTFEYFVRPALGRMCGMKQPELPIVKGLLQADVRQAPGRTSFMPAWAVWEENGWKADPIVWKNSADIIGFTAANATFIFPRDKNLLQRGETVDIMLLPDFFLRRR